MRLRLWWAGSVVDPGFGIAGELEDGFGEGSVGEIGEGDGLEDGAEVGTDGDPDLPQGFGGARVLDGLRVFAPDVCQGALDGPDHVGEHDLLRRTGQPVSARGSTPGADYSRAL